MEYLSILGSTGSIGCNALDVVRSQPDRFRVVGLASGRNVRLLAKQAEEFAPEIVSVEREEDAEEFRKQYSGPSLRVVYGTEGAEQVARHNKAAIVLSAITGISGLRPTLAAVEAGKRVALANKESLVVAGRLLREKACRSGASLFPVDSEHSGVFQCLAGERRESVRRVILTASGGPFFRVPLEELPHKTVEQVLDHPRWKMGKKVTTDSATLMNKGLELIEARWLFDLRPSQLDILIHPQSIVHSLVELTDGSVLAQLSQTDMRLPIQYALTYPQRVPSPVPTLDLSRTEALEFFEVDAKRFPLIPLARKALESEDSYAVALNAANEAAVEAFLDGAISFTGITEVISRALECHEARKVNGLEDIFSIDRETREQTKRFIESRS